MEPITLRLSAYDIEKFGKVLERNIDRLRALRDLKHTTEAEKQVFIYEMALCQTVLVQVTGDTYRPANGAPDWSAAEASGTLPSEALRKVVEG